MISSYQATPDHTANVAESHDPTDLLGSLELCCLLILAQRFKLKVYENVRAAVTDACKL